MLGEQPRICFDSVSSGRGSWKVQLQGARLIQPYYASVCFTLSAVHEQDFAMFAKNTAKKN